MSKAIQDKIIETIKNSDHKLKPGEITRQVAEEMGVSKEDVKAAIKALVDTEEIVYTYEGGSFLVINPAKK